MWLMGTAGVLSKKTNMAYHVAPVDSQLVAERDVLQNELGAVLSGELEQVQEKGEVRHPPII